MNKIKKDFLIQKLSTIVQGVIYKELLYPNEITEQDKRFADKVIRRIKRLQKD